VLESFGFIVPIKIKGLYEILPKGAAFPKIGKVKAIIGKPIKIDRRDSFEAISNKLEKELRKL